MKTDSQLHKDVLESLTFEPSLDASNIAIAVKNGVVTLSGEVPSYADFWNAERIAEAVSGALSLIHI